MDLLVLLIIILVVVFIWRGPKTMPRIAEALGRGVREARTEASKAQSEIQARTNSDQSAPRDGDQDPPA